MWVCKFHENVISYGVGGGVASNVVLIPILCLNSMLVNMHGWAVTNGSFRPYTIATVSSPLPLPYGNPVGAEVATV